MGVSLADEDLGECLNPIRGAPCLAGNLEPFDRAQSRTILVNRVERGMNASQRLRCPDELPGLVHTSSLASQLHRIEHAFESVGNEMDHPQIAQRVARSTLLAISRMPACPR